MLARRVLAVLLFVLAAAVTGWLSLAPGGTIPHSNEFDKTLHVAAYAGLMLVGGFAVSRWRWRMTLAVVLTGYGLGLEWLQSDLPQHQASAMDMLANLAGLSLACLALWAADRRSRGPDTAGARAVAGPTREPTATIATRPDRTASAIRPPVRHDDSFLDTFLKRLDPDVAASFTDEQLRAIRLSFGAQARQRHPLDVRRSVLLFHRRYYVILLAGRERRNAERLHREGMVSRLLDALAILLGVLAVGGLLGGLVWLLAVFVPEVLASPQAASPGLLAGQDGTVL